MITKSGKHHFRCDFSTYLPDGTLAYKCEGWTFTTADADAYMQKLKAEYGAHQITAAFENLVDLDS